MYNQNAAEMFLKLIHRVESIGNFHLTLVAYVGKVISHTC